MGIVDAYLERIDSQETVQKKSFYPQLGPQTSYLQTPADIAIYGGAAGGGKTYALLLEPLRHFQNPKFGGVIFRRNTTQVRNEGGLWDESFNIYPLFGAQPRYLNLNWSFPSGSKLSFSHLEYEKTVLNWQGSQIAYIGFDELTHFSESQFFYMLSRNRSSSGVPGYIRATTNPDVNSWVRSFIDWWIGPDGYPIKERSGKLRYFVRIDDTIHFDDTKEALIEKFGTKVIPKTLTFIPSSLSDNKVLMDKDPAYLANLMALPRVERLRLLGGNWDVKSQSGLYFQRGDFEVLDTLPAGWTRCVRYWDKGATKPSEENPDPDWTRGLKMYKYQNGTFVVADIASIRDKPFEVEKLMKNTASQDGHEVRICVEQEPGAAGVADVANMVRLLQGYDVRAKKTTKKKVIRALPVSAQSGAGNIKVIKGKWNEEFFKELENFPPELTASLVQNDPKLGIGHDDQVDALSGAFNELCENTSIMDVL